jgi:hypothetical protein
MKAKKEAYELQRECNCKTSNIQKLVQQLKKLELQMQDIHEQHVKNTQVIQVPIIDTFSYGSFAFLHISATILSLW